MLRLTSLGRQRAAVGASSAARTRCERFAFGGVAFELLCPQGSSALALSADERRFCVSGPCAQVIAGVVCAVHDDPAWAARPPSHNRLRFGHAHSAQGPIALHAHAFEAELSPLASHRYAAAARVGSGPDGYAGLLRGVVAAVLHRHGGLVVHAAALELDGRAVLFVGPSRAAKSTAVGLADAGRCFAYEYVALVPTELGWFAWGLPGGTPIDAPLAPEPVYPLAAVLRVRQADSGEPQLTRLALAQALSAVRESISGIAPALRGGASSGIAPALRGGAAFESADETLAGEEVYLRAATQLASAVPIGAITTVMQRSTSASLRAWLAAAAARERTA